MTDEIEYNPSYQKSRWVAFFDLLGTKEIIRNESSLDVFVAYSRAIAKLKTSGKLFQSVKRAWFSDSFVIYTPDNSAQSFVAIESVSRWFLCFLVTAGIPARGAISYGSFYADRENSLYFGSPLIEAYEYGEAQNWIGFILCPSAEHQLEKLKLPARSRVNYSYADIPYNKRKEKLKPNLPACILGRWVIINNRNRCVDSLERMRAELVKKYGNNKRIAEKYDNTLEFIRSNRREIVEERSDEG